MTAVTDLDEHTQASKKMALKNLSKHFRKRLNHAEIDARVKMKGDALSVAVPSYGYEWTKSELKEIANIALATKCTFVRGQEISEEILQQMTGATEFHFYQGNMQ
jgi:hypothetical protein